jgi:hypothetical protein
MTGSSKGGFQHTVIHLSDDFDVDVDDYFIELFAKKTGSNKPDNLLTQKIQHRVISSAHSFGNNKSYRSLLIDTVELKKLLVEKERDLFISLTAMPEVDDNGNVGYSTFSYDAIGSIKINWDDIPKLFQPDRTILLDIKIKRQQKPHVFEFKTL